jgi:hypothetical protein
LLSEKRDAARSRGTAANAKQECIKSFLQRNKVLSFTDYLWFKTKKQREYINITPAVFESDGQPKKRVDRFLS